MRNLFLVAFLTFSFILFPSSVFAAEESCASDEDSRCECTDSDGVATSLNDSSISDGDSCASTCSGTGSASYAFYCGDQLSPVDSGDITTSEAAATTEELVDPSVPVLNVPLPTLSQDDFDNSVSLDSDGNIVTNMIGVYVNAVFSYAIVIAALFGVLMLMIAGLQYMTAGGDKGAVAKAKGRIQNAVFGLILLMATYSIAFLIDPRTTRFNSLVIQNIAAVEYFPPEGEDLNITPNSSLTGAAEDLDGDYIIPGASDMTLDGDALTTLQEAAQDFYDTYGYNIYVSSAKRDLEKQATLFYNNCLRRGGYCSPDTCNPASSSVVTKSGSRFVLAGSLALLTDSDAIISALVSHAAYGNCPHTSAVAIDAWCNDGGGSYQHDPACQDALIKTMIDHGFCRLTSEAWHFELDSKKVSSRCLTSNNSVTYTNSKGTFTPSSTCKRWDFKNNKCVASN